MEYNTSSTKLAEEGRIELQAHRGGSSQVATACVPSTRHLLLLVPQLGIAPSYPAYKTGHHLINVS